MSSIKDVLEFYADPFVWKKKNDPDNDVQVPDFYSELSFGDRAQETLASLTKSEGHGQDASVKCAATGVHPTDTSCTAEPEVAPGHSDALATLQPDGERRDAIARIICCGEKCLLENVESGKGCLIKRVEGRRSLDRANLILASGLVQENKK